jgi:ABC-type dipeptide/oligopeptide/nickel transport system ATPase component
LLSLSERAWRRLRGNRIAFVPQSPIASLNPAIRLETQLREAWRVHAKTSEQQADRAIAEALELACLPSTRDFRRQYPAQLSVGLAQRVLIAMAVLHRPSLLIADEPTSALDAITQADVLRLFADLNARLGTSILYISHDLLSVASLCHRVAILDAGELVEIGPVQDVFRSPRHPFVTRLVDALPVNPFSAGTALEVSEVMDPACPPSRYGGLS